MSSIDWFVLLSTIGFIVTYGVWKTRKQRSLDDYLNGGREAGWITVGLSVMATQASAITFLSTPGQAFESGMGFIQIYFGLPLALVLVSIFAVPKFFRSKVFTAYEYLENRFDLKTRLLTAFLFLIQRSLAAGFTIYAPAIVLSTVLGWDLNLMNVLIGGAVIIYTVTGGTKAVNVTHKWQMTVILGGMFLAFFYLIYYVSAEFGWKEALALASANGKLSLVNTSFDFNEKYTLWAGLLGGLFLSLSYFGTDQSQVQRYLSARTERESKWGLIFNAILKIPMQFFILGIGVLLFLFYQQQYRPLMYNESGLIELVSSDETGRLAKLSEEYDQLQQAKISALNDRSESSKAIIQESESKRASFFKVAEEINPDYQKNDADYVFISFVLGYLPEGIIGLLIAVILSAGMSSTAGELNALSTTTMNDFVHRFFGRDYNEQSNVRLSRWITAFWGVIAISFSLILKLFDNLIELVNVLGSLFYGTILGIFICAFFIKTTRGNSVFWAALIAELLVILLFFQLRQEIGYLWFNAFGCMLVIILATLIQFIDLYTRRLAK